MRKQLIGSALALVLAAFVFTACSKNDNQVTLTTPAPTNATAVAGDDQVVLKWTAPKIDPNNALKSYQITWTPGTGSATATSDATSYTVKGLSNGTDYTFSIVGLYNNAGKSEALTVKAKTTTPAVEPEVGKAFAAVAAAKADTVIYDKATLTYLFYYNKPNDLKEIGVGLVLNDGATIDGQTGTISKSMNLSAGPVTLTVTSGTKTETYTFKAEADIVLKSVGSTAYKHETEDITIDHVARTITIAYGIYPVNASKLNVSFVLSEGTTMVTPSTVSATIDASSSYTLLLHNRYKQPILYTLKVTGGHALFDPKDITGIDVTSDRQLIINNKICPANIGIYKMVGGKAYLILVNTSKTKFTVYGDPTATPFSTYVTHQGQNNSVLLAANIDNERPAIHEGKTVIKGTDMQPTFAYNMDGTYLENSSSWNGDKFLNYDAGQTEWKVNEAFSGNGFYLNPGASGGYTSAGTTKAPQVFFATTADYKMYGFMIANTSDFTQDQVCKTLINIGLTVGFPLTPPNSASAVAGLVVNGETIYASDGAVFTTIGLNE